MTFQDLVYFIEDLGQTEKSLGNIIDAIRDKVEALAYREKNITSIDLGACYGNTTKEDGYVVTPISGSFPLEKINGKKGRLVFIEEGK